MKKTLLISSAIALGMLAVSFDSVENVHKVMNMSGAPIKMTGSPGDGNNCTSCHLGSASNRSNVITTNIPSSGYVPGNTYTITVSITEAGINRFGFELSPQNAAGDQLGTFTVTDATNTQLVGQGKYLTHKLSGTSGNGSASWSADWTAPSAGTGNVTFYAALNAANGNNSESGDMIFTTSETVKEDGTNGITNTTPFGLKVFPNPSSGKFTVSGIAANSTALELSVYDLSGKLVKQESLSHVQLSNAYTLDLTAQPKGVYLLKVKDQSGATEVHKLAVK